MSMEDNIKVLIAGTECIEAMQMIRKKQLYLIICNNIIEAQIEGIVAMPKTCLTFYSKPASIIV